MCTLKGRVRRRKNVPTSDVGRAKNNTSLLCITIFIDTLNSLVDIECYSEFRKAVIQVINNINGVHR